MDVYVTRRVVVWCDYLKISGEDDARDPDARRWKQPIKFVMASGVFTYDD